MRVLSLFLCTLVLVSAPLLAQNGQAHWPQFRGPGGTGSVASSAAPLTFDKEKDVLWRVEVPKGHSSPCVWGDRVFLTGHDGETLLVLAFDRADGKEVWRHSVKSEKTPALFHPDANRALPTPCTNGKRVFCYFGSYGLIAFDLAGKVEWEKRLPVGRTAFGIGTSPMLVGDTLMLVRDGSKKSSLVALDEATGKERWRAPRLSYRMTHCTPFHWRNKSRNEIVVAGTRRLTSYDPKTGEQLWQVDGLTPLVCTSPTANEDLFFFAGWSTPVAHGLGLLQSLFGDIEFTKEEIENADAAFKRLDTNGDGKVERTELRPCRARDAWDMADQDKSGAMEPKEFKPWHSMRKSKGQNVAIAVKPGGEGDVTKTHVKWKTKRGIPYVASPLLHDGRLYLLKSRGILTCLDAETGKPHFGPVRLKDRGEYYAAPVGVGKRVVLCSTRGTIYVLAADDGFEIERTIELGERVFATPAVTDDRVFLRTEKALWAFGRARS